MYSFKLPTLSRFNILATWATLGIADMIHLHDRLEMSRVFPKHDAIQTLLTDALVNVVLTDFYTLRACLFL